MMDSVARKPFFSSSIGEPKAILADESMSSVTNVAQFISSYKVDPQNEGRFIPLSLTERMMEYIPGYRLERQQEIQRVVRNQLDPLTPHTQLVEALEDAVTPYPHGLTDAMLTSIGVSRQVARANPDLVEFIGKNKLVFMFKSRGLRIKISSKSGSIRLPMNGKMERWSTVKQQLFGKKRDIDNLALPHGYRVLGKTKMKGREKSYGIVSESFINPSQLVPTSTLKAAKREGEFLPGRCYVEVVSTKVRLGRHCFIRLVDQEGNIFSIGYGGKSQLRCAQSMRMKVFSPDPRDTGEHTEYATAIQVTSENFSKIKAKIKEDIEASNKGELYFNMVSKNCAFQTTQILKLANIHIDVSEHGSDALIRKSFEVCGVDNPNPTVLKVINVVATIIRIMTMPIYVLVMAALGGLESDERLVQGADPHQLGVFDRAKEGYKIPTGWKMCDWINYVESWRDAELAKLESEYRCRPKDDEYFDRHEKVRYGVPGCSAILDGESVEERLPGEIMSDAPIKLARPGALTSGSGRHVARFEGLVF